MTFNDFHKAKISILFTSIFLMFFSSCSVLNNESSKYGFNDGFYTSKLNSKTNSKYYVENSGDSIKVYPFNISQHLQDTNKTITVLFPESPMPLKFTDYYFKSQTFDIDVLTTLFKYRPAVKDFPNQFHSNLSGAVYTGYRIDIYKLSYNRNPLHIDKRNITHFGYSFGGFAGMGSAHIDEFVTLNRINYEYDGAVLSGGLAIILGLNKLNFGITSGVDYLTDKNRKVWINEMKPWIGISVGLNLN